MKTIFWLSLMLILSLPTVLKAQPAVNIGADTTVCGDSLVLDAQNPLAISWTWSTGATTQMITVDSSGLYWVEVTDVSGTTRDSINVVINNQPVFTQRATDSSYCEGIISIMAQANAGEILWKDSSNNVIGFGSTLLYDLQNDSKIWYEATHFFEESTVVGMPNFTGGNFYGAGGRGITFSASEVIRIDTVSVNINNSISGNVVLRDNSGTAIASKAISLTGAGVHTIDLGFVVPAGVGYDLYIENLAGPGQVYSSISFPPWATNFNYPFMSLTGSSTGSTAYQYFYRWKVSRLDLSCSSDLDSVLLNSLEVPVINLAADTSVCGDSLVLDVTNIGTGYAYNWAPGNVTTGTITAFNNDTYYVTVTLNGQCPREDSINVEIRTKSIITQRAVDSAFCRGTVLVNAQTNYGDILWKDSSLAIIGVGDTFYFDLQDTTKLWYDAAYWESLNTLVGMPDFTGGAFYGASGRGITFSTNQVLRIDSVSININGPIAGEVVLRDNFGARLASKNINLTGAGIHILDLGFVLPVGTDFNLYIENLTGTGQIYSSVSFPPWATNFNYPFMSLTGSSTGSAAYQYFYRWNISTLDVGCASDLDSVLISALPTPNISLGVDTSVCGNSLILDATNPGGGFTYQWLPGGQGSATITALATGTYSVTVTSGGQCPVNDSIAVELRPRPVLVQTAIDTSFCRGLVEINALSSVGYILWKDSFNNIVGIGDTLLYDLNDTTELWYEATYLNEEPTIVGMTSFTGGAYYGASDRGISFNTSQLIRIDSVSIDINGPISGEVVLRDNSGTAIASKSINLAGAGVHVLDLGFIVPTNTGYNLYIENITGTGQVYSSVTFPGWASNFNYPFMSLTGSSTGSPAYQYFYRWKVSIVDEDCVSNLDSVILTMLPTPEVNLAQDTIICSDSTVLNVFYPGASYQWGGGQVTDTLLIVQEGNYEVTLTIGSCTDEDAISVFLNPLPSVNLISSDTSICRGLIDRISTGADVLDWYTEPVAGTYLGTGDTFIYDAQVSDTIWVEGRNYSNKIYQYGLPDTGVTANAGFYFPRESRGLLFNANESILLESVEVYTGNFGFQGEIQLWDENDVVLYSTAVAFLNPGANLATLNYAITEGTNYKLLITNYNVTPLFWEEPYTSYPIVGNHVTIQKGIPAELSYNYFYNWQVKGLDCPSERIPSYVEVLNTPVIDFPIDTIVCGDSLILDMSSVGALTYLWSTGETTSAITVDSSTRLYLTGTINTCADMDSVNVFIVEPPTLIIPPNDTTVCQGNMTFYASGNAAYYAWYDSLSSETPFALGDSILLSVQDTTTFWVEGIGFIPKSKAIGATYNPSSQLNLWTEPQQSIFPNRELYFDVHIPIIFNSLKMYVDTATTGTLRIYKSGFLYFEKNLNLTNVIENLVTIDTLLEPGNYSIELSNKSAGKILTLTPFTNFNTVSSPEITITGSAPQANRYNYFFDWRISTPSCATDRLPVQVNVPLSPPITMVADTATCTQSSLVLDPIVDNNPNYSYLWSTTSPDDTLVVSSSGYYSVTVTNDGICSSVQDVFVQFLNTPSDPAINDTSICSSGIVDLGYTPSDGIMVWYDSANLGEAVYITSPYSPYVADATNFWVDVAPRATTRIGVQAYPNPSEQSAYLSFIIANTFDVHQHAVLDSVAVYVDVAPATMNVVLMDSVGNVIYSSAHTVTQAHQKVFLPLNYILPPGQKYQLTFSNPSSSFLVDQSPVLAPSSSAGIATLTGTVFSGVNYNTFFDWHFSYAFPDCHSNADTFAVSVSLPVDLVDSIFTCDTAFVDLTNPNVASYFWSIGQTTGAVTFLDAGLYFVTMSDGGVCTVVDSVEIVQPMPVGLPTINANCGYLLSTNYSMADASFNWNTGDTTNAITLLGTGTYTVTVTTNEGCVLYDTAAIGQIVQPPTAVFQNPIDACSFDTLDAGFGGQAMTYLWSTGEQTQKIVVNTTGYYTVTVTHPLGCAGTAIAEVNIHTGPTASFSSFISNMSVGVTNTSVSSAPGTTFQWDFGDSIGYYSIGNPGHTYQDSNCYTVSLVVTDDCGTDTAWHDLRIGISPGFVCDTFDSVTLIESNIEDLGFDIIPNPNAGNFQIRLTSALKEESQMLLYDLNGRMIYEQEIRNLGQTQWDVQLNNLSAGVYFIRLVNSKQSKTHRVVILRE